MTKKKEYAIKRKKYIIITGLIILLFFLFLFISELSYDVLNQLEEPEKFSMNELIRLEKDVGQDAKGGNTDAPWCIYVVSEEDARKDLYVQALSDSKQPYVVCSSLDEVTSEMLDSAGILILGGKMENLGRMGRLRSLLSNDIALVFTSMPDLSFIREHDLQEVMGIREVGETKQQKGIRLQEGFFMGGRVDLEEYEYVAPVVTLMNSCKVYLCGLPEKGNPEEVENEDLPPLIWRNLYEGRKIFTVNGSVLEDGTIHGFLYAVFSETMEDFIYPVVGEIVFAVENFPYYCNVDSAVLQSRYSRDAERLQRDILWPDFTGIGKREDLRISYYATEHLLNEIPQTKQEMEEKRKFYSTFLEKTGGELIQPQNKKTLEEMGGIPIALDGFYLNDKEKLQYYATLTAQGAIIQRLDITDIILGKESRYDWVKASKSMKEIIGYYINRYRVLPSKNVSEADIAARIFRVCRPEIKYEKNAIHIRTRSDQISYSFLLRTQKEVEGIDFGKIKKMEQGTYYVTTMSGSSTISLLPEPLKTYEDSDPMKGWKKIR